MLCVLQCGAMSVEKLPICAQWQLYVALFKDVTNLKELRQSVIDGQFDVSLISPTMVCIMCDGGSKRNSIFGRRQSYTILLANVNSSSRSLYVIVGSVKTPKRRRNTAKDGERRRNTPKHGEIRRNTAKYGEIRSR